MTNVTNLEKAAARLAGKGRATAKTMQAEEANHIALAEQFSDMVEEKSGQRPVYSLGAFYTFDTTSNLWKPMKIDQVALQIGDLFRGNRLCKKAADYRQIAGLVANLCESENFFQTHRLASRLAERFTALIHTGK